jgi:hypothetical protein
MIKECLGDSSMHLGVPFIAPRQLGAVGGILGRLILPSVGWRTRQSGVPPNSHCSCPVCDSLPNLAQPTVADLWQLAHRTLSSAHRTVRCPLPTVGAGHASHADLAADRCADGCWLTGQSGAPLNHQNILEMAQGHISLSVLTGRRVPPRLIALASPEFVVIRSGCVPQSLTTSQ